MKPSVEAQVATFLKSVFASAKPDYVVTVERKGTALLRTLLNFSESAQPGTDRSFVASDALHFMPNEAFKGKQILLLDDAMYQGRRITKAKKYLTDKKHVQPGQIKVAAFSVHEQVEPGMADYFWFGQLRDAGFRAARDEMIRSFQESGSLLLATDRVGIVAELNCGKVDFFDALCRLGSGVEWFSSAGRLNLTIHNLPIADTAALQQRLPADTLLDASIHKIRIVERADGRFAICPIFYPATPSSITADGLRGCDEWLQLLLGPNYAEVTEPDDLPIAVFQASAFIASVALLESVSVALSPLTRRGKVMIKVPSSDGAGVNSHLRMLFPLLDVAKVTEFIQTAVQPTKERSRNVPLSKRPMRIEAGIATTGAAALEALHWRLLKQSFIASERQPDGFEGATWRQIRNLILTRPADDECFDQRAEALLSAALDKAIDEADIVTGVHSRSFADGRTRLVRVFRPDGELINGDMRRICAMWKKDTPPPKW